MSQDGVPNGNGLAALLRSGRQLPQVTTHVSLEPLRQAVRRIEKRWPDMAAPDQRDREAIVQELAERLSSDNWGGCRLSLVCAGIRAAFDDERREREDLAELRAFYFREVAVTGHTSLLNAALATYLESFELNAGHTNEFAKVLESVWMRLAPRAKILLAQFPSLLDPQRIVDDIAQVMIEATQPYQRLVEMGVRSPHGPGLMNYAHLRFVRRISSELGDSGACDKLLDWLRPQGKPARRAGAAEAIDAIVRPWTRRDPPTDRQTVLTRRLVEMYGDPRRMSGDPWHRIEEAHRALFLRWLTGENLRLLFDAITDTNDSHMWSERREFYLGLHRQKRIDAAWVAFAPAGDRQARRILEGSGHGGVFEFGRQLAGGSRTNTSLLIVKVGSKIVVDGSHSYKVHVFRQDDPRAPQLYLAEYDCERIRRSSPESKSHQKGWQHWVLMRI